MNILPPPGPQRNWQLGLLAILLVVVAVVGWRYFGPGTAARAPAASNSQVRATAATGETVKTMPQPVQLGKLEPVPDAPVTSRNPFRFGVPPPPPAPPRPNVPPPPVTTTPTGPPPPPPITLKFVGRLVQPGGRVVATLSDGKGGVWQVVEGQIVDGRYRLLKIGEESAIIEYLNGTGRTTLPLR
jgi:hypothetical protein